MCLVQECFFFLKYETSQKIEAIETENYLKLYPRRFFVGILCVPQIFMASLLEVLTKPLREAAGSL